MLQAACGTRTAELREATEQQVKSQFCGQCPKCQLPLQDHYRYLLNLFGKLLRGFLIPYKPL
jgi:hypothetical protein